MSMRLKDYYRILDVSRDGSAADGGRTKACGAGC